MTEKLEQLYLGDLHVGQRFASGTYVMEAARIKEFAAEFDPQPFHLDERAAQASIFKGLAASGWHTAAVAMRLLVTGGLPFANGIVTVQSTMFNQNGEAVSLLTAKLLVLRRPK